MAELYQNIWTNVGDRDEDGVEKRTPAGTYRSS